MISARLVHLIESHADQIVGRTTKQMEREAGMDHSQLLLDFELRDLGQCIARQLGDWLSSGNTLDLGYRCERLGKLCSDQAIPIEQALRALSMLREKMLDFAQEQLLSNSSVELYAEEELDRRLVRFFDRLAVHLVRGFEQAIRSTGKTRPAIH